MISGHMNCNQIKNLKLIGWFPTPPAPFLVWDRIYRLLRDYWRSRCSWTFSRSIGGVECLFWRNTDKIPQGIESSDRRTSQSVALDKSISVRMTLWRISGRISRSDRFWQYYWLFHFSFDFLRPKPITKYFRYIRESITDDKMCQNRRLEPDQHSARPCLSIGTSTLWKLESSWR